MNDGPCNILFLCTGNSARSILAEAYMNARGGRQFRAYSAGSHASGRVNPDALELLVMRGFSIAGLRSKSWDEFARSDAPHMDFIITVCDNAAGEVCPVWPGHPATAHWPFPDPATFAGSRADTRAVFLDVFTQIRTRIDKFLDLPFGSLDAQALRREMAKIGSAPVSPEGMS